MECKGIDWNQRADNISTARQCRVLKELPSQVMQIQTLVENDFLLYKEEVRRVYHERN
ncbi:hypothetical protein LK537_26620 [Lachnoclostridium pacaense]|uniref:hypothetical protein n=1 Tax=Enterocloster hominis (ex Hitch et al. 2024) TaxID=1917870 RepID=UPI001D0FA1C2|nr:hypothetical protein [Lachnoclostridium pacaense]MCC2820875.1 hypothetical protein [Lachnoclostridium pacaense]